VITSSRYLRALAAALIGLLILGMALAERVGASGAPLVYTLTGLLVVAVGVATWLGFDRAPLWLAPATGTLGLLLIGLLPAVTGAIGVYFGMALAGLKQRAGLAVAIALELAFLSLELSYRSERYLPAAINGIGLAAVYLGTAGVQRWREARIEAVQLEERARLSRDPRPHDRRSRQGPSGQLRLSKRNDGSGRLK
jgi:hypothetical protein